MSDLFPMRLESDLAIYATQLYSYGMTAALKTFVERSTMMSIQPFFEIHEGRILSPLGGASG